MRRKQARDRRAPSLNVIDRVHSRNGSAAPPVRPCPDEWFDYNYREHIRVATVRAQKSAQNNYNQTYRYQQKSDPELFQFKFTDSTIEPGGRPLTVGTDCSGIEAPLQALHNLTVPFTHVFSSECDKVVQSTIHANWHPQQCYDDITTRDNTTVPSVTRGRSRALPTKRVAA